MKYFAFQTLVVLAFVATAARADERFADAATGLAIPEPVTQVPAADESPKELNITGWLNFTVLYDTDDGSMARKLGFRSAEFALRADKKFTGQLGLYGQVNAFASNDTLDTQALHIRAREAFAYFDNGSYRFVAGKFFAPIGFESADPPDIYQISNGLVYSFLSPTEIVGLSAAAVLGEWQVEAFLTGAADNDYAALRQTRKLFGGRVSYSIGEEESIGFAAFSGPQGSNEADTVGGAEIDGLVVLADAWIGGFEINCNVYYLKANDPSAHRGRIASYPCGTMVMTRVAPADRLALTMRWELLRDGTPGVRRDSAPGAPLFGADLRGHAFRLQEFTLAPSLTLSEGWELRTEARYDWASDDFYLTNGKPRAGMFSASGMLLVQF